MRLTDHDASFLYGETASSPMHGAAISALEGESSFEAIFAHLEARIHLVPRYRQRLVFVPMNLAHAQWVDDPDFDLADHVVRHQLTSGATTVEEAFDEILELAEGILDRSHSLWKMYVVEGIPGQTVLVSLAHHAMIDGASSVDISVVLMDFEPDALPPGPPNEAWDPKPLPSPVDLWAEALQHNFDEMIRTVRIRPRDAQRERLLQRGTEIMTRFMTQPVVTAPWNAGIVGRKRRLQSTQYRFAEFREIRRALGGTINDVVLAVVTESAARYLEAHSESVANQYFRVMCPVSVRREDETGTLGNRVSAMYPTLPAWSMDIGERFAAVVEETVRLKANLEPQALELLMETSPYVPPVAMAQTLLVGTAFDPTALAAQFPTPAAPNFGTRPPLVGFNFTCTNVPGVQVPQYIAGHKVLDLYGTLMLSGTLGYGVVVASYDQRLYFNFTCDPRLLPNVELMRSGVEDAFAELHEFAETQGAAKGASSEQ
jgi:diacylglycerol O-acyltransferase